MEKHMRKERDSNPRYLLQHAGFQDRCNRPTLPSFLKRRSSINSHWCLRCTNLTLYDALPNCFDHTLAIRRFSIFFIPANYQPTSLHTEVTIAKTMAIWSMRHNYVDPNGLEPLTLCVQSRCSSQTELWTHSIISHVFKLHDEPIHHW